MAPPVLPPFTTTPNRNNPADFSRATDQYHIELTPFVPLLNIWATEVNTLGDEIFNARDTSVNAKDIALSTVNYKGDYVSGTYNLNESVTYSDGFNYVSKINGNTDIPTTSNWYRVPNIDDTATTEYQMWSSQKINTELTTLENNLTTEIDKKVNIDGNQTINNVKTFSSSPIVPTPANGDNSSKVANTEYVENNKLEIATTTEAQSGVIDNKAITPLKLRQGLNANGNAPIYACRAWVNFNGSSIPSIRASGNISSIVDNGTGDYTINIIEPLPDSDYEVGGSNGNTSGGAYGYVNPNSLTTSSFSVQMSDFNGNRIDRDLCLLSVRR